MTVGWGVRWAPDGVIARQEPGNEEKEYARNTGKLCLSVPPFARYYLLVGTLCFTHPTMLRNSR